MKLHRERTPARLFALEHFGRRWTCCGHWEVEPSGGGDAVQGPSVGQSPEVLPAYINILQGASSASGSGWTLSNVVEAPLQVDNSPSPYSQAYQFTDNSLVAIGFARSPTTSGAGTINNLNVATMTLSLNGASPDTHTMRFEWQLISGATPQTISIDLRVNNGDTIATVGGSNVEFFKEFFLLGTETFLRVNIVATDIGGNSATLMTIYPDVGSVTGTGAVIVKDLMIASFVRANVALDQDAGIFRNPPYIPSSPGTGTFFATQTTAHGRQPRGTVDLSATSMVVNQGPLLGNYSRDAFRTMQFSDTGGYDFASIAAGGEQNISNGWWAYFDAFTAVGPPATPTISFAAAGLTALRVLGSGNVVSPFSLLNDNAPGELAGTLNCAFWLAYFDGRLNTLTMIPIGAVHGRLLFTANGTFTWPFGVMNIYVSGAGGGGGGGSGGASGGGGGGGSGQATYRQLFTRSGLGISPGSDQAVVIGAGGAGGVAGAGSAGIATTLGAFLTLSGGGGGAAGGLSPGNGGVSGGTGGQLGQKGFDTRNGGIGGGNIAGGVGGLTNDDTSPAVPGLNGGGGGGGPPNENGGDGGNGFILIEW